MWLLYANPKKFGNLFTGASPFSDEVKFYKNVALCPKHFWKRIHIERGCIDITPRYIKRMRDKRQLKTILVFAEGGIGDSLWVMPFTRYLREKHPQSIIVVVTSERSEDVWRNCPFINKTMRNDLWLMFSMFKASEEIYNFGGIATVMKKYLKMDPVEAIFKEAEEQLPKDKESLIPRITLTIEEGKQAETLLKEKDIDPQDDVIISIAVHSSTPNRDWCITHIKNLTKILREKGYKIIWVGSKGTLSKENIDEETNKIPNLNLVGETSLRQCISIIAVSNLLITPNTGLMVAGASVRTPTLGLFGAFNPKYRTKFYARFKSLWIKFKCHPCDEHWTECQYGHPAPCMKALIPEIVLPHALDMLKQYTKKYLERGAYE
jgi:ADP-heptose:LPS heptosyltransferase